MSTGPRYYGILNRGEVGFDTEKMSWAHWLAVALAAVTGVLHVYLYIDEGFAPFLFAGGLFLGTIVALLLNLYRRLLYVLGIPFTAGQIVMWTAQGMPSMDVAIVDKSIQVLLILLLAYLFLNEDEPVARGRDNSDPR